MNTVLKPLLFALVFVASSPGHAAGITETARLAAQACINQLEGRGVDNAFLLSAGFFKRGQSFIRRATGLGLTGHSDRASIKMNTRRKTCQFSYDTNRGAIAAFDAYKTVFRENGYQELVVQKGNRTYPAFEKSGRKIDLLGTNGHANQSFYMGVLASIRK